MTVARAKQPSLFPRRELGVLLHPTSLFGREDVGTLGPEAFAFVDWLEQAGVTLWQILPLTPNGLHNSPYFSASAFAGNPWLIDLGILRDTCPRWSPDPRPRWRTGSRSGRPCCSSSSSSGGH